MGDIVDFPIFERVFDCAECQGTDFNVSTHGKIICSYCGTYFFIFDVIPGLIHDGSPFEFDDEIPHFDFRLDDKD